MGVLFFVWGELLGCWMGLDEGGMLVLFEGTSKDSYYTYILLHNVLYTTNHQNKGIISMDRRTSLLSHVQYPVP